MSTLSYIVGVIAWDVIAGNLAFIVLIHLIQWTIANLVGTDRPTKCQKSCPVFPLAGPVK